MLSTMGSRPTKPRRAFSIIELMVVIGIVMILISLLLPTLGRVKLTATELNCLVNLRTMSTHVVLYTNDYEGHFPSWKESASVYARDKTRWYNWAAQSFTTLPRKPWHDYTGWNHLNEAWHCPANDTDWDAVWPESFDTDYELSASMFARPAYLNPALSPKISFFEFGGKLQRISTVKFPSQKVGLFEKEVWNGWSGVTSVVAGSGLGRDY